MGFLSDVGATNAVGNLGETINRGLTNLGNQRVAGSEAALKVAMQMDEMRRQAEADALAKEKAGRERELWEQTQKPIFLDNWVAAKYQDDDTRAYMTQHLAPFAEDTPAGPMVRRGQLNAVIEAMKKDDSHRFNVASFALNNSKKKMGAIWQEMESLKDKMQEEAMAPGFDPNTSKTMMRLKLLSQQHKAESDKAAMVAEGMKYTSEGLLKQDFAAGQYGAPRLVQDAQGNWVAVASSKRGDVGVTETGVQGARKAPGGAVSYYRDPDGNIVRQNPDGSGFDVQDVNGGWFRYDGDPAGLKKIGGDAGGQRMGSSELQVNNDLATLASKYGIQRYDPSAPLMNQFPWDRMDEEDRRLLTRAEGFFSGRMATGVTPQLFEYGPSGDASAAVGTTGRGGRATTARLAISPPGEGTSQAARPASPTATEDTTIATIGRVANDMQIFERMQSPANLGLVKTAFQKMANRVALNPEETRQTSEMFAAIQDMKNSLLRLDSGLAVTDNEARRQIQVLPDVETLKSYDQIIGQYNFLKQRVAAEVRSRKTTATGMPSVRKALDQMFDNNGDLVRATGAAPAKGGGKPIDKTTAAQYLQQAGGDKAKAREMAKKDGWRF